MTDFLPVYAWRSGYHAVHRDTLTGEPVFSTLVSIGAADGEFYFRISEDELDRLLVDDAFAAEFDRRANRRELDDRRIDFVARAESEAAAPDAPGERFVRLHVNRQDRYSLDRERATGRPVFSIPVSNQMCDYEEWYWISEDELALLVRDKQAARAFAVRCGRREMDDRLVLQPGTDRGYY